MNVSGWRGRAIAPVVALIGLAGGGAAFVNATATSAQAATPVTTETEFRDAWANDADVVLGADITLTCQEGADPGESEADRDVSGDGTLDGQGFTITQTCPENRVLHIIGDTGAMTLQNVGITGGQAVFSTEEGGNGGGGIQTTNDNLLTVVNSNISGNKTCEGGGGIEMDSGGDLEISGSTFADNFAEYGGGVATYSDLLRAVNSTVTRNSAFDGAGGISADSDLTLVYTTITQNEAGVDIPLDCTKDLAAADSHPRAAQSDVADNIFVDGDFGAFGNIVAQPAGGNDNCMIDTPNSSGYNFSDDDTCGFDDPTDSVASTNDPTLGALTDNGGPTPTLLPLAGSPVIDGIPNGNCGDGDSLAESTITTDQRAFARPETEGGKCDIGAVEVQASTLDVAKVVTGTNGNSVPSTGYSFTVSCSDGTSATLTVADATAGGTSAALGGIKAYSACRVTEAPVVYTVTTVSGQPSTTYDPAAASSTDGIVIGEGANTVTVTNDYTAINLLGIVAVNATPRFTG